MEKTEQERLLQLVQNKLQPNGAVCPLCGHRDFTLVDGVLSPVLPSTFQPNVVQLGGPRLPMVVLVCTYCGWTAQIAAKILDPQFGQVSPTPQRPTAVPSQSSGS